MKFSDIPAYILMSLYMQDCFKSELFSLTSASCLKLYFHFLLISCGKLINENGFSKNVHMFQKPYIPSGAIEIYWSAVQCICNHSIPPLTPYI